MGGHTKIRFWFVISILLLTITGTSFARQIFADAKAKGNENGSSWTDAYKSLQDALAVASSGDEILVARGIYKPDDGNGITPKDRSATFKLINGVTISGGYAGYGELKPDKRDVDVYTTTLSGDLNGDDEINFVNDEPNFINYSDNSYNVVTGFGTDKTAVLDGFTIIAGCCNSNGAGIHNYRGSPTLKNCTFKRNTSLLGAGMYNNQSYPTLVNCTFTENLAGNAGGAIYNCTSSPTMTDCSFSKNVSLNGGAMYNKEQSNPILNNCTFDKNSARSSGAIANYSNSNPTLTNCTFKENSADHGGAMRNFSSSPTLTNCTFTNNSAEGDGGGMNNYNGTPVLEGCLFVENSAKGNGGAIRNYKSSPTLTRCTLTKNSAEQVGGGISNYENSDATISRCILWQNSDGSGDVETAQAYVSNSTPAFSHCCIQGWTGNLIGGGSFDADPLFVNPDNGDYNLLPESPCIPENEAKQAAIEEQAKKLEEAKKLEQAKEVEPVKQEEPAKPKPIEPTKPKPAEPTKPKPVEPAKPKPAKPIEARKHEYPLLVPSVYPTIQEAIDTAYDGDEVIISPGAYNGPGNQDIDFKGKAITVRSVNPLSNDVVTATIIDCGNEGRGFYFHSGEDENSIINGLTIVNGNATDGNGGGIYCEDSSPTLKNCIIGNNSTKDNGGGMYNNNSNPTLANCRFTRNDSHYGGAIHNNNSNPTITNCTFNNNNAKYGGAIYNCDGSSAMLKNCMFSNNSTTNDGGAMNNQDSNPTLTLCIFTRNSTNDNGGAMFNQSSTAILSNCKFFANTADDNGGGVFNLSSDVTLTNCTFKDNSGNYHGGAIFNGRSSPTLTDCTFNENSANSNGGGIYNREGSPTLTNCIFSGNLAKSNGGGMFNNNIPTLTNCTFSGNSAEVGGGLYNDSSSFNSTPILTNCIFWDNRDSGLSSLSIDGQGGEIESSQIYGGIPTVTYTCIQKTDLTDPNAYPGIGNIKNNPCFVKPGYWTYPNNPNTQVKPNDPNAVWVEGNYHLRPDSPCVDAGDPESDFSKEPPPNGGRINIGAYGNTPEAASKGRASAITPHNHQNNAQPSRASSEVVQANKTRDEIEAKC